MGGGRGSPPRLPAQLASPRPGRSARRRVALNATGCSPQLVAARTRGSRGARHPTVSQTPPPPPLSWWCCGAGPGADGARAYTSSTCFMLSGGSAWRWPPSSASCLLLLDNLLRGEVAAPSTLRGAGAGCGIRGGDSRAAGVTGHRNRRATRSRGVGLSERRTRWPLGRRAARGTGRRTRGPPLFGTQRDSRCRAEGGGGGAFRHHYQSLSCNDFHDIIESDENVFFFLQMKLLGKFLLLS